MKYISLILLIIIVLTGCQAPTTQESDGKITIMATLFPQYDFARIVGGDQVTVTLILPPGVEAHAYEPTPKEVGAIQKADLFLYTGEQMEPWAHRLVSANEQVKAVDLSQAIVPLEQTEDDHEDHDEHEHEGIDPHIWTDPNNAITMVETIRDELSETLPEQADYFEDNAQKYITELKQLDRDFTELFAEKNDHEIFFAGHNAFGYFIQRYDLHFHTPYTGFSPDAEPSPRAITELMEKMSQSGSKVIYYEELIEPKVAQVIRDATGADMMLLNGAHNISKEDLNAGVSYLDIMRQNLAALDKGLQ